MLMQNIKLSLGPLLYYWSRDTTLEFYTQAANWPVDVMYLGETVCSRRHELRFDDWMNIAQQLTDAGKEVVLSTLTLIESESDLKALRKIVDNKKFSVEANDMGAVHLLSKAGVPFVAGPALNIYNPDTLALMASIGAVRWVPPVEMPRTMLMSMPVPDNIQTEIFAFGRLPLAFSARCFTARHFNLQKDDCQFRCIEHADGLDLNTREGEAFLVMNGIQTQSASVHTLAHRLDELNDTSVTHLRLSPQSQNMAAIIKIFRDTLDEKISTREVKAKLDTCLIAASCDGYWLGKPGLSMGAG